MDKEVQRYVTVSEAADQLRVGPQTVYRWCRTGRLSAVKIGGEWRIPAGDLGMGPDLAGLMPLEKVLEGLGGGSDYLLGLAPNKSAAADMEIAFFRAGASLRSPLVRVLWGDNPTEVRQHLQPGLPKAKGRAYPVRLVALGSAYEKDGLDGSLPLLRSEIDKASRAGTVCFIYGSPIRYFRYNHGQLLELAQRNGEQLRSLPVLCMCAYVLTDLISLYEGRALSLLMELMSCHTGVIWFDGQRAVLQRPPAARPVPLRAGGAATTAIRHSKN